MKSELEQQHRDIADDLKSELEEHRDIILDAASEHINPCTATTNGLTTIFNVNPISVPCDGNSWIVVLRRVDNDYDFPSRDWNDYREGFGDLNTSFWLGLKYLHRLTTQWSAMLKVELEAWDGEIRSAQYSHVRVSRENDGYRLFVDGYSGDVGDSLSYHSGTQFTTSDRDNDLNTSKNCAKYFKGAWWHNSCYLSSLAGEYITRDINATDKRGLQWLKWKSKDGKRQSFKRAEMKLLLT